VEYWTYFEASDPSQAYCDYYSGTCRYYNGEPLE
jgi:hypothetical protein